MKPYTIVVIMKNGDVIVHDGWADNSAQAGDLISEEYRKLGATKDIDKVIIHPNRIRKHPGFYQIRQIIGKRLAECG